MANAPKLSSRKKNTTFAVGLSFLGAALLVIPAHYYQVANPECTIILSFSQHLFACTAYLLAVALLGLGWVGVLRGTARAQPNSGPTLGFGAVLGLGGCVHLVALLGLPFLSSDPLYYAAIGRAMTRFGAEPYARLCDSLPDADPFLAVVPQAWRCGTNPYGPVWNGLMYFIGTVAGPAADRLPFMLRLYQLLGLVSIVGTAALAGLSMQGPHPKNPAEGERRGWAAALVLFSPLGIIEGTVNAHNDAVLALLTAAFAFLITRRRTLLANLMLLMAVGVKLSALLLCAFYFLRQTAQKARRHQLRTHVYLGMLLLILMLGGAAMRLLFSWQTLHLSGHAAIRLLGSPASQPYCTRSVECLPRALFFWVLHEPAIAWGIGLLFRGLAGVWLIYAALRRIDQPAEGKPTQQNEHSHTLLRAAAIFILFYYLYLHAYMQSWYLLSLLPLLCHLPERLRGPAQVLSFCATAYYVFYLPVQCFLSPAAPVLVGASEFAQAAVAVIPPTVALVIMHRKGTPIRKS